MSTHYNKRSINNDVVEEQSIDEASLIVASRTTTRSCHRCKTIRALQLLLVCGNTNCQKLICKPCFEKCHIGCSPDEWRCPSCQPDVTTTLSLSVSSLPVSVSTPSSVSAPLSVSTPSMCDDANHQY